MGKEGVYLEDHEDHLSIHGDGEDISYNQSQYSPKKYRDSSSRFDRQTIDAHSDEVYQNGSYLGKLYSTCHNKYYWLKFTKMELYYTDCKSFCTYLVLLYFLWLINTDYAILLVAKLFDHNKYLKSI